MPNKTAMFAYLNRHPLFSNRTRAHVAAAAAAAAAALLNCRLSPSGPVQRTQTLWQQQRANIQITGGKMRVIVADNYDKYKTT
jgi:hypothetical protein